MMQLLVALRIPLFAVFVEPDEISEQRVVSHMVGECIVFRNFEYDCSSASAQVLFQIFRRDGIV